MPYRHRFPRRSSAACRILIVATITLALQSARAADDQQPEPQGTESTTSLPGDVARQVDDRFRAAWTDAEVTPAPLVSDPAYLRRVTLDLAGRVPTVAELHAFLDDPGDDKRSRLVERLIASPDFAFHLRNTLDLQLLASLKTDNEWREFLLEAARENRAWNDIFADVLLPEYRREGETGPAAYLRERVRNLDDLTNDTAVLFFGVNIGCAKCHDHPLVSDWLQDHYYGMSAFFKRTYKTKNNLLAEQFDGDVKFTTVFGDEKQAEFMFLSGAKAAEPSAEFTDEQRKEFAEAVKKAQRENEAKPPVPPFSPRQELVRLALDAPNRSHFAHNFVNRTWARLTGYGLVDPLDQMHSSNPPSHPDVLTLLSEDFIAHGYDIKRLVTTIVLTETYARSSEWESAESVPSADTFARSLPRPLTPRQLAASLIVATANPDNMPGLSDAENWEQRRTDIENRANGWASQFHIPEPGFQVAVEEALLFSNNDRLANDFLRNASSHLVGKLMTVEDPAERLQLAFESVLTRSPFPDEQARIEAFVADRTDREESAWQQVVWALVASPEFRFNH